jgi:hypothetical protein
METKYLPTGLRELADRIETAELPDDLRVAIDIRIMGVNDTVSLLKCARLIGDGIKVNRGVGDKNYLQRWYSDSSDSVGWYVWFRAGLLGGRVVSSIEDDAAGLQALLDATAEPTVAR